VIEYWIWVMELAIVIASLAAGGAMVYLVNWIKNAVGASGNAARVITLLVAVLIALAIGVADGVISGEVAPGDVSRILLYVIAMSQYWFQRLQDQAQAD
jgi:hypothetical protein